MTDRADDITAFLAGAGWAQAARRHLAGDASNRCYERLRLGAATAVLMDNPPGGVDDPVAFSVMARHLGDLGLSAPRILAEDLATGLLLLEDLGDDLFARLLAVDPTREADLYAVAVDTLLHLQAASAPKHLADLTAVDWANAASLAPEWYARAVTGGAAAAADLTTALAGVLAAHADGPRVLILRDFHSENLLWLPGRQGLARVGILDFQLGQMGQRAYDLVSLLQDARRDVALETEAVMIDRFARATGQAIGPFRAEYAAFGAQRALRILGIFARLCVAEGKPHYVPMIPRVWGHLQRNLAHPALAALRTPVARLPEPTPATLQKIASQCPPVPSR